MYPVDLLKVRRSNKLNRGLHAQTAQTRLQVINPSPGGIYTSLTNAVSTITKIEGAASLWRGISSVIVGAGM